MPVPEIQVPTVQAEAQPAPAGPDPALGAFAGAHVGAGLSKIGEELYGVGLEAYHRAAQALAQEKENDFQKRALQIRDQFKNLYNFAAVQAHPKASSELEKAREDILNTIPSKYGRDLYMNNSLRNARLMQESIDSHFEQQNKSYQFTQFKQGQELDTQAVAAFAADGNLAGASEKIKDMQTRAKAFANSFGLDPDDASNIAATKGAHSLIRTMLEAKNPLSEAAYKQWGEHLDPSYQAVAQKTMAAQSVSSEGEALLANLPRVDADGKINARGRIASDEYREALARLPADAHGGAVRTYVEAKKAKLDADDRDAGQQLEERMRRLNQKGDVQDTADWQEFSALYPTRRDRLLDEWHKKARRVTTEGRADEAHAGREAFGRVAEYLRETTSEEIKAMRPEAVADQVRNSGGRAQDVERAQALLAKLQKEPGDAVGQRIPFITRTVLNTVNPKFARTNQWQAVEYLESLHEQHKDWTPTQLGKDLSEHIVKGWFGRKSLEVPRLDKAPGQPASKPGLPPAGQYKKPDGSIGNWDGTKWQN